MLAYIIVALVYNMTEAGFRMLHLMWIWLLLAVVISNGVVNGLVNSKASKISPRRSRVAGETPTPNSLIPERQLLPLPDVNGTKVKSTAARNPF